MKGLTLALTAVSLVALAAVLGRHVARVTHAVAQVDRTHLMTRGDGETIDWSRPLVNGIEVADLASTRDNLTFSPIAPAKLGTPSAIWQTATDAAEPAERSIVVVYEDSAYGPLWLVESPTDATDIGPGLVKSCMTNSGCQADRVELVTLDDGSQASVQRQDGNVQNAVWEEGGVMYTILGQADSLAWDQAIALTNDVAKASGASVPQQ